MNSGSTTPIERDEYLEALRALLPGISERAIET